MPQLNPAPWFMVLVFSWMIFLVVIPPKVLSHLLPNEPTAQSTQKQKATAWNWQW